jgi:pSer/pThr/pTyr-binding forkhead associated (FHA) protein
VQNWILKIRFVDGAYEESKEFKDFRSLSFGRSPDCNWPLSSPLLSRNHFKINFHEGKIYLEDLNSTNGTQVNGLTVPVDLPLEIKPKDKITTGQADFYFIIEDWKLETAESTDLIKAPKDEDLHELPVASEPTPQIPVPSSELIFEAQQKASAIIAKAYEDAEIKSRELFNKAQEERLRAQKDADRITQEAQFNAQKTMSKAQELSEKLLEDARISAQSLREQAHQDLDKKFTTFEQEMKALRDKQNEHLRNEAEGYSLELKKKAQEEIEFARQNCDRLLNESKALELKNENLNQGLESLEKLQANLKAQNEEWLEKVNALKILTEEKEQQLTELTKDLKNREDCLKKIEKEFFEKNSQLQTEHDAFSQKLAQQKKVQEAEHFEFLSKHENIQTDLQQKISRLKAELELTKREHREKTEKTAAEEKERLKHLLQQELKTFHEQRQKSYQEILNHLPELNKEVHLLLEKSFGARFGIKEVTPIIAEFAPEFEKLLYRSAGQHSQQGSMELQKAPPLKKKNVESQKFWAGFAVSGLASICLFVIGTQVNFSLDPVEQAQL